MRPRRSPACPAHEVTPAPPTPRSTAPQRCPPPPLWDVPGRGGGGAGTPPPTQSFWVRAAKGGLCWWTSGDLLLQLDALGVEGLGTLGRRGWTSGRPAVSAGVWEGGGGGGGVQGMSGGCEGAGADRL